MLIRPAIFVLLFVGVSGFAQQQSSNQQSSQQPQSNQDKTQSDKQQQSAKPSPDETNPFPEAISRKAEEAVDGTNAPAEKSPAPDYSSSKVDMKRFEEPNGSESRISNGAGGYIHSPELAAQDVKVGLFYLQTGNFKGAYDRYKEATLVAPENADAVFGLAESARELHLTQEAVANYTLYLDAFPDGKRSKDARKALATLSAAHKK
jgi:tetratricopeptide (TPR) repeat protein